MSKVFISCDMEGCSGIVNNQFCDPKGKFYKEAQAYMTGDLNAAIKGLQDAGVDQILINDSHWNMTNIRIQDLPSGVELISGDLKLDSMVEGLDASFDAVAFIGYHPMWGNERGVIAHTYSGITMRVTVNDKPVGETGIMGLVAGYYDIPVIFVAGDSMLKEEVCQLNPDIHFTVTKEGRTRLAAKLYHPDRVHHDITETIGKAWVNRKAIKPLVVEKPVRITVKFKETQIADMCMRMPQVERVDNLTVAYEHHDYLTVYRAFLALQSIGSASRG
ncbi:MAG: M55 family metallopeptidase [FCB group bacterium]|nr:M55 family metallopeptidase [FCB group bacterium]